MRRNLVLLGLVAGMGVQAMDWYAVRHRQVTGGTVEAAYDGATGKPQVQYDGVGMPMPKPEVKYDGVGMPTPPPQAR
jgi:hypothetical protein